jgi:valyl-tRNA synthetase
LPGRIENGASKRLVLAKWPRQGKVDDDVENDLFPRIKRVIQEIRRLRTDYTAEENKVLSAIVASENSGVRRQIESSREMIELLAKCRIRVEEKVAVSEGSAHGSTGDCMVVVENLVDAGVERERTSKRKEDLTKQKQTLGARLANEAYIAKAPAKLVQQTRDQLAEVEAELAKLG